MPEGDVIHALARTFDTLFVGRAVRVSSPQGRFAGGARLINGRIVTSVRAHGKHFFMQLSAPGPVREGHPDGTQVAYTDDLWLHVHLGLYGSWRLYGSESVEVPVSIGAPRLAGDSGTTHENGRWTPPEPVGQVRVRIETDDAVADLSGPNRCEVITPDEQRQVQQRLGPDPLSPYALTRPDLERAFIDAIRSRSRTIGELVMDQSVIAGVGNIYRAESLFITGIHPRRRGNRVAEARLSLLWKTICPLMAHGLEVGRIETVSDEDAPEPPLEGDPEASRWYVYHRTGRPCLRCGTPVAEDLMATRRLFWCPGCQR